MCVCVRGVWGGILDQDVIHYDTWLRKHSQYAFTRLSAKMFEIKSTRKLEQVISTGVHSKQHKEKKGEIKIQKSHSFVQDHGDL